MTDLTPPPDRPLDDAARARLRAQLLESLGERPGTTRRWLAPVAAAAAVVLIAGVIGFLALRTGAPADSGAPGGGFAADPTSATPGEGSASPTSPATSYLTCVDAQGKGVYVVFLTDDRTEWPAPPDQSAAQGSLTCHGEGVDGASCVETRQRGDTVYGRPCTDAGDPSEDPCDEAVDEQIEGARLLVGFAAAKGTTEFWASGSGYVLCDDSGGIVTTHRTASLSPPERLTADDLAFSSSILTMDQDQMVVAFVAGGLLPETVDQVRYEWPGGHVETADVETDAEGRRWWRMEYTSYDGPLSDPQQSRLELGPVAVTVVGVGTLGDETVVLEFGRDDCAQVNHGC